MLAAILSMGMTYGHLGVVQLLSAQMAHAGEGAAAVQPLPPSAAPAPKNPGVVVEPISPKPNEPPTTYRPDIDKGAKAVIPDPEQKEPLKPKKGASYTEASHDDDASYTRVVREEYVPPVVTVGDCEDLYSQYGNGRNFCSAHNSGRLPEGTVRTLEACIKLSYQQYIEGQANQMVAQALQIVEQKPNKSYDGVKIEKKAWGNAQKEMKDLSKRLDQFSDVFFGDKGYSYMSAEEQAYFKGRVHDITQNPGTSDQHFDACYHLAQDSARKAWGSANFMTADFHRQTGTVASCESIFEEGRAMFFDVEGPGIKQPEDRKTVKGNAKDLMSKAKMANNGVPYGGNPRATASNMAERYGKAIDLANECKQKEKAKGGKKWLWLLLLGAIGIGLYFLLKKKKKPKNPKPPRKNPPKEGCPNGCGPPPVDPPPVDPPPVDPPPVDTPPPTQNPLGNSGDRGTTTGSSDVGTLGFDGTNGRPIESGSESFGDVRDGDTVGRTLAPGAGATKRRIAK